MSDIVNTGINTVKFGVNTVTNTVTDTVKFGINTVTEISTFKFLQSKTLQDILLIFASYKIIILLLKNTSIVINTMDTTKWYNQILDSLALFATIYRISNKFIFAIYLTIFHAILQYYFVQNQKEIPIPILNKLLVNTGANPIPTVNTVTLPIVKTESVINKSTMSSTKPVVNRMGIIDSINSQAQIFVKIPNIIFSHTKRVFLEVVVLFIFSYFFTNNLLSVFVIFILYFLNNHIF